MSEELIAVRDWRGSLRRKNCADGGQDDREHAFRGDLVKKMGELDFIAA